LGKAMLHLFEEFVNRKPNAVDPLLGDKNIVTHRSGRVVANPDVWSAAALQAKNEDDIVGLRECIRPLCELLLGALMECAALLSLVTQAFKPIPGYRFQECRVRPLCHRHGSPANLAGIEKLFSVAAGL
jgi:hypothetical protein